jgi:hypothetical protein
MRRADATLVRDDLKRSFTRSPASELSCNGPTAREARHLLGSSRMRGTSA